MSDDDDDLRFGDISSTNNSAGSDTTDFDPGPLIGAGLVVVILIIVQPIDDIMLTVGIMLIIMIGGIMGSLNI